MPIATNCGWCDKGLSLIPAKARPVNFCSRQCSGKYRQGKTFHSEASKGKMSLAAKARGLLPQNLQLGGRSLLQVGEKHPRWKGNAITPQSGRHRAQHHFPLLPCAVCGKEPQGHRVHRHHKDGDTRNNNAENIICLCALHHKAEHKKLRQGQLI